MKPTTTPKPNNSKVSELELMEVLAFELSAVVRQDELEELEPGEREAAFDRWRNKEGHRKYHRAFATLLLEKLKASGVRLTVSNSKEVKKIMYTITHIPESVAYPFGKE